MKNMSLKVSYLMVLLILPSCADEPKEENPSPINLSNTYSFCNSQLSACISGSGDYCLFGFKWGQDSVFQQSGYNAFGPVSSGGELSFSFQETKGLVNTHRQIELPSNSFDELLFCAKVEIRKALMAWSEIADIEFQEQPLNSESDIRFFTADIVQSGIGYPNYPDELCNELSGKVIIQSGLGISDCHSFYIFALHEIGHVLGLGHVSTETVMNPNFADFNFQALQLGDSLGILELYGEK